MMSLKHIGIGVVVAVAVLAMGASLPLRQAEAVDLSSGEVEASLDTTLSYGVGVRVEKQDRDLIYQCDPREETLLRMNDDDGNCNYNKGIISNTVKFTSDLDISYQNMGLFLRATGLFDHENENGTRDYRPLTDEAKSLVGKDIDLLDAYVSATLDFGEVTADVRLGNHVLNWGESTFIQNGINAVNPFDVSKLRVPGAELREALVPVPLISTVMDLPNNFSMEGFYQFAWDKTEIDPPGTYFSTTDYVGPGAKGTFLSDERLIGALTLLRRLTQDPTVPQVGLPGSDFLVVKKAGEDEPRDTGQWGVALRYLAEGLNNTEFGVYFMNYHSRLPTVRAHTGTVDGTVAGIQAIRSRVAALAPTLVPKYLAQGLSQQDAIAQATTQAASLASPFGVNEYVRIGERTGYVIEYPEDIQLYGVSFSTLLGTSGWALQGEYSFRQDVPLQILERELIEKGLLPFFACFTQGANAQACIAANAPGTAGFNARVPGSIPSQMSQVQATATRVFGPTLGADGLVFLTEAALQYVHDMPDTPLESPAIGAPADSTSFGYRMATRLDYNNLIGGANVFPYLQWQQDLKGNGPQPVAQFLEGRTALTAGVRVSYLARWEGNVSYTQYGGGKSEIRDRDFVTATIKYSF